MTTQRAIILAVVCLAVYAVQAWYWYDNGHLRGEAAGIRWATEQLR